MTVTRHGFNAGGQTGAARTLAAMRRNVRECLTAAIVWETARRIVSGIPPRAELEQARALRLWVDQRFRFQKDPLGVELLETPRYLLEKIEREGRVQGDCDDAATLTAALGLALGIPAKFHAVAFGRSKTAPFAHVYTTLHPMGPRGAREPVEMDVTHIAGTPRPPIARALVATV